MKFKDIKKQIDDYNNIETFKEQLDFLKNNSLFCIHLDNDAYYISIIYNEEDYTEKQQKILGDLEISFNISEDFGNRYGVFELFKAIGINCEGC